MAMRIAPSAHFDKMAYGKRLLAAENVTVRFGGVTAVDNVSLAIDDTQVYGLIGPNGAGKTTFFNSISGVTAPDSGRVIFDGMRIEGRRGFQINKAGMARTYQIINLFSKMSVLENVMVGLHSQLRAGFLETVVRSPRQRREEKEAEERAYGWLDFAGLRHKSASPAGSLSYGEQRLLEIVRGLASLPKLLLLDEPASGMNNREKMDFDALLREILNLGVTIFMIEHDMQLMMGAAHYVFVMCNGGLLAKGAPGEVQNNQAVIDAYLGGGTD